VSEDFPALSPEVRALLDRERTSPPLSPAVRARALAAARAAMAAGGGAAAPRAPAAWTRWAVAAGLTGVAAVAAATVAYRHQHASAPALPAAPAGTALATEPGPPPAPAPLAVPSLPQAASPAAPLPRLADDGPRRGKVTREELRLLSQARAAVAREDFAGALSPLAEHAREFPNGRLTEEREALHVKALVGLGRGDEARRAATSFAARFPRSVLLPAVRGMSARSE